MTRRISTGQPSSLYPELLQMHQIRLLHILPSIYFDDGQSSCGRENSKAESVPSDADVDGAKGSSHELCPDRGCCNDCCPKGSDLDGASEADFNPDFELHSVCASGGCIDCDHISCELIVVNLDDVVGKFDALFYVWGASDQRDTVLVNGFDYSATANLGAALRRVRNVEKVDLLWADAVCLNQTNITEKNLHVPRMKDIYASARRVLAWLGDAASDFEEAGSEECISNAVGAVTLIENIHKFVEEEKEQGESKSNNSMGWPNEDLMTKYIYDAPLSAWMSLVCIGRRPWFGRIWVIQEIAYASEVILMIDESSIIDWKQLVLASRWMSLPISYALDKHFGDADTVEFLEVTPDRDQLTFINNCMNDRVSSLTQRLLYAGNFQSTVPHDKIYALLGLSSEGQELEKYPRVRVDYTRDWRSLYRDVVRHCIETGNPTSKGGALLVLNMVFHGNQEDSYNFTDERSSWVPRWAEGGLDTTDWTADRPLAMAVEKPFVSSKGTGAVIIESPDDRILPLNGILADKIVKIYHSLNGPDPDSGDSMFRTISDIWFSTLFNKHVLSAKRYPDFVEAFVSTLFPGHNVEPNHSQPTIRMEFLEFWKSERRVAVADKEWELKDWIGPWKLCLGEYLDLSEEELSKLFLDGPDVFHLRAMYRAHYRVFFVTEKGFIGRGPLNTSIGDEVCVLYGGVTPFVIKRVQPGQNCPSWLDVDEDAETLLPRARLSAAIRRRFLIGKKKSQSHLEKEIPRKDQDNTGLPRRDVYRLVGECFVAGLMDGEALDLRDSGEFKEQTFHFV